MSDQTKPDQSPAEPPTLSKLVDNVKVDINTIKIILLTAAAVVSLCCIPFIFILRNFVTFGSLDKYLGVTEGVRPNILRAISEEVEAGYSKDIVLDSPSSNNNTLIFYAAKDQKVTLTINVIVRAGSYQAIGIQVDGCEVYPGRDDITHLYNHDLTSFIATCAREDEPSIHSLRAYTRQPPKPGTALDISCLVLVFERVHTPIESGK